MNFKIVKEVGNTSLISSTEGDKLYKLLYEILNQLKNNDRDKELIIDFSGVEDLTTAFLNNGISKLFYNLDIKYLLNTIKFIGLKKSHIGLLKLSLNNAIILAKKNKE